MFMNSKRTLSASAEDCALGNQRVRWSEMNIQKESACGAEYLVMRTYTRRPRVLHQSLKGHELTFRGERCLSETGKPFKRSARIIPYSELRK
jgi:hypothetical protein